jgi:hypothetical protein
MRFSCLVRLELAWPLLGFLKSGRIIGKVCTIGTSSFLRLEDLNPQFHYDEVRTRANQISSHDVLNTPVNGFR